MSDAQRFTCGRQHTWILRAAHGMTRGINYARRVASRASRFAYTTLRSSLVCPHFFLAPHNSAATRMQAEPIAVTGALRAACPAGPPRDAGTRGSAPSRGKTAASAPLAPSSPRVFEPVASAESLSFEITDSAVRPQRPRRASNEPVTRRVHPQRPAPYPTPNVARCLRRTPRRARCATSS